MAFVLTFVDLKSVALTTHPVLFRGCSSSHRIRSELVRPDACCQNFMRRMPVLQSLAHCHPLTQVLCVGQWSIGKQELTHSAVSLQHCKTFVLCGANIREENTLKSTNSLKKWYFTPICFRKASMCFVRFSLAVPSAICFAVTLSHLSSAGSGNGHLKNLASPFAHKTSLASHMSNS